MQLIKKKTLALEYSCEFSKIVKNIEWFRLDLNHFSYKIKTLRMSQRHMFTHVYSACFIALLYLRQ